MRAFDPYPRSKDWGAGHSDHVSCFEVLVGVWLYHEVALAAAFGRVLGFDDYGHFFADELLAEALL